MSFTLLSQEPPHPWDVLRFLPESEVGGSRW